MAAAGARQWIASRPWLAPTSLVALLLMLVILLAAVSIWQSQRDARSAGESRATSSAYVAAVHVQWLMEANFQALQRVADTASAISGAATGDTKDLNTIVATLPGDLDLWIYDAGGRRVLATDPARGPADVSGQDFFLGLKAGAERFVGSWLETQNGKVFPIAMRMARDGRFLGAAVVYAPATMMTDFWASMDLGPGSTVGLIRDDGWLITRHPLPPGPINLSEYVLFTEHLPQGAAGLYRAAASPVDGVARLVAYRRVAGLPLIVVVGLPEDSIAASFRDRMSHVVTAILPIGAALLVVSIWLMVLFRREAEAREHLSQALEHNRVLLREMHHRAKNNLQSVAALIRLQPGPPGPKEELVRRLVAMSAVHEHIYAADRFGSLDLAAYITTLIDSLQRSLGSSVAVSCHVTPLEVSPDVALPLGLIVNEAVSNAFKHAFPDSQLGRVDVSLERWGDDRVRLTVRDNGIGYHPQNGDGMGTRLIHSLARQLGGEIIFSEEGGTVFTLEFPLPGASSLPADPPQPREVAETVP